MNTLRADLAVIADLVPQGARVLDIGCGDGELLEWLKTHKAVDGRGIEINQSLVAQAIARGISVVQGDVETDLDDYQEAAYDYVILSQTLQTMRDPKRTLEQLARIGKKMVISVPNFGYWKNRLYLTCLGKMPVTRTLSYSWYDTPNIHFCTITDFVVLCESLGITIESRSFVDAQGQRARFYGHGFWANLFGEQGVFLLSRTK